MIESLKNYINGNWSASVSKEFIEIRNPAFDDVIAFYPKSTLSEVDQAVEAAQHAFQNWKRVPVSKRASLMFDFRNRLMERKNEIATIMVNEHGKTLPEAIGELGRAIECIEYVCGAPELQKGTFAENVGTDVDAYCVLDPIGTFTILPPFNFPALISCYFVWPVALGNTVVVKPPDLCPMTVQVIMEVFANSGFPPGVVNMVCGSSEVGHALVVHPSIAGVTFVGSSKVGKQVYKNATMFGKRAQIQAGAKNHIVVTSDCNLFGNMSSIVNAAFGSASQRCFAASNILIHEPVYKKFIEMFIEESRKLRLGYGMDKDIDIGPLVSNASLENAHKSTESALASGAHVVLDGRNPKVPKFPKGYFMAPTILEADPSMDIWKEEVFAPVRCVRSYRNLSEAIEIINQSDYGHSAAIFTESGGIGREFARQCNTGHVGINVGTPVPMSFMSVGGRKASFFGDLRGQGEDAVRFCTDKKFVAQRWAATVN
jgi:malonate-semialdehyde dehydrogenase (acetylating)/methylmalonate-semialdehyde dehydrogenase